MKEIHDESDLFGEVLLEDWKDVLEADEIVQTDISKSSLDFIRAWHRCKRGHND
jgi:dTDP-4-dehydrorhamnose 3,5-epimerase-like enzyme